MKHVILGNGPAGVVAAETLRQHAPRDEIVLVGSEREPPYSRMAIPYLLIGRIGEEGTYLRKSADHFERARHPARAGPRRRGSTTRARTVTLEKGAPLAYDRLLIATGSHPIKPPIPGIDAAGRAHLLDARRRARDRARGAARARACCRSAPASSAASSWSRSPSAACS